MPSFRPLLKHKKKTTLRVSFSHARSSQSILDLLPSSFALGYFWTTTTFLRVSLLVVFQAEIADLDHGVNVAEVNAIRNSFVSPTIYDRTK